jgi:diguanylate cyclase (GGDEF)-like protein
MDTTTLVLANVLLFALCTVVILVNTRIVGGMRSAMWFAGANLCRGAAMLFVGVEWLHLQPARFSETLSALLSMAGVVMLHRAFAEMLERRPVLLGIQFGMLGATTVVSLYLMIFPSTITLPSSLLFVALAAQYGLIAYLVSGASKDEVGPVGWLTSLILGLYASIFLIRLMYSLRMRWPGDPATTGGLAPFWLTACLMTTAATTFGFMSISSAKLRVELMWRAQVDDLTGLLNRWALKRMALKEIQRCRRSNHALAVVMMDLDGLKMVNDTKGHSCGDVVLQAVAGVLQETVRLDDSVARMGGDEFCVLLPETSMEEALVVAERLRAEVEDLVIRYRGETVATRASLGVASSDLSGLEWQNLVDDSDAALYRAKREGKNRVIAAVMMVAEDPKARWSQRPDEA